MPAPVLPQLPSYPPKPPRPATVAFDIGPGNGRRIGRLRRSALLLRSQGTAPAAEAAQNQR